jgi:hypothetical protein
MHTKPLSPSTATLNPDVVNILMVARDEMLSGAALRASAISASWGIMNSLSGGYFGVWAPAAALAKSETRTNAASSFPYPFHHLTAVASRAQGNGFVGAPWFSTQVINSDTSQQSISL